MDARIIKMLPVLFGRLKEIEKDCITLKRKKDLTEYGRGELHIIDLVKETLEIKKL